MSVLETFLIQPVSDIVEFPLFFIEVVIGGLSAGVMYSLVALGFVLIFKASGVFNFAQGVLALFAALTLVGITDITGLGWCELDDMNDLEHAAKVVPGWWERVAPLRKESIKKA